MKKVLNVLLKIILCIVIYILQTYVFCKIDFFGVTANCILSLVVVISMLKSTVVSFSLSFILGVITDVIYDTTILQNVIIFLLVTSVISTLKSIYKQDRKTAIIILVTMAVTISELVLFVMNIQTVGFVNIITLLLNIIKQSVINIFIAYVIYIIITKLDKIEE